VFYVIDTGTTTQGLRWAGMGRWRLTLYAGGGYAVFRRVSGVGWRLPHPEEPCPEPVVAALLEALARPSKESVK
jgi:hypothetical protein